MTTEEIINLGADSETAEKIAELFQNELGEINALHQAETEKLIKENENIKIRFEIEKALSEIGVWSEKAVYAMLNFDNIKVENGVVVGVREEIERIKKECGVLFKDTPAPKILDTANSSPTDKSNIMRNAMGL